MSTDAPSPGTPHPDDKSRPADRPGHPEPQLGDWLGAEEVGPAPGAGSHDPDPITEQVLFSDLLPKPEPAPPADPADALADLPPADPTVPGSGWLEPGRPGESSPGFQAPAGGGSSLFGEGVPGGSNVFDDQPASAAPAGGPEEGSNVLSAPPADVPPDGGSDVLRSITDPDATSSNIFDARPEGSARFEDPAEATEPVTQVRPSSETFDDPLHPASDVFAGPAETDHGPADDAGLFEPAGRGPRFEDSGVDLLHPEGEAGPEEAAAPASSIFEMPRPGDGSDLDVAALPMAADDEDTESIHLPTGEAGPPSDLFRGLDAGTGEHDRVSFDMPDRDRSSGPESDASQQVSGLIDWTVPVEGAELEESARLTESDVAAAGVPDLQGLAAETPPPTPASTPGPAPTRRPPSTVPDMGITARRRPGSQTGSQWSIHDMPAPSAKSGGVGWLVGTAVGVLLGAGAFAGAYFTGLLPSRASDPIRGAATGMQAPAPAVADAKALLEAGDPTAALRAYQATDGMALPPEDKAARGRARWLARVRELAEQGTPARANDPQLQAAAQDLQAAVDAADQLQTADQKRAGALAALHLGLLKEMTGRADEARSVYAAAQGKFPGYGKVFETALKRVRMAPPLSGKKTAALTPRQAEEFAGLAALATILLQADPNGAAGPLDDEAGFHFWEACELASKREYLKAADEISRAKAAHDRRRLTLAGRGLNPLSDPLEQIFSRACGDLRELWVLKHHFYNNPELGNEMRAHAQAGTLPKFMAQVVAWRDEATKGGGQVAAQLRTQLAEEGKKLQAATRAAAQERQEKEAAAKELTATKRSLDDQAKQLADARAKVTDAEKREKAAGDALAAVVQELKAAKLIDEKDDVRAAVAKLPEVLKKASAAAASADAQKAAAALLAAKQDLEKARDEAKAARADAAKAEALAKKATDDGKKAVEMAQASAQHKLDELTSALARTRREYEDKLAAKDEEHRRQLADARAGALVPLTSGEMAARERASHAYSTGVDLFFARRYAEAEAAFARATTEDANNAVYWYYLGLSRWAQSKSADEAFQRGGELEARNRPNQREVNAALERVPNAFRRALNGYRP